MAYISRPSAARERDEEGGVCGFVAQGLPEELTQAETFEELRENLVLYAQMREEAETKGRTHYRTLLSFERPIPGTKAAGMVKEWLNKTFPGTRAISFVHQNTEYTHAHVWIDARKVDGKKLDLSPREYRSLDEVWNRIYCRELGRDERDHLDKKSHGREQQKARSAQRQRALAPDRASREGQNQERGVSAEVEGGAGGAFGRECAPTPGERFHLEALATSDQAVRAAEQLYRDASKLDRIADRARQTDRGRQ